MTYPSNDKDGMQVLYITNLEEEISSTTCKNKFRFLSRYEHLQTGTENDI